MSLVPHALALYVLAPYVQIMHTCHDLFYFSQVSILLQHQFFVQHVLLLDISLSLHSYGLHSYITCALQALHVTRVIHDRYSTIPLPRSDRWLIMPVSQSAVHTGVHRLYLSTVYSSLSSQVPLLYWCTIARRLQACQPDPFESQGSSSSDR